MNVPQWDRGDMTTTLQSTLSDAAAISPPVAAAPAQDVRAATRCRASAATAVPSRAAAPLRVTDPPATSGPSPAGKCAPSRGAAVPPSTSASVPDAAPDPDPVTEPATTEEGTKRDDLDGAPPGGATAAGSLAPQPLVPPVRLAGRRLSRASRGRADTRLFERFAATREPADRAAIVERYLPLARQLAASYQRPSEPFDDIYQVACYGLVKAVDRFDLGRGRAFTSYAVPTIVGEIKRHFRDRTWAVRVPRDLQELSLRVDRVVAELTRTLGRQPSVSEVADTIAVEPDDVLEAMEAGYAYRANSLDGPRVGGDAEDGATLGETLGSLDDGFARAEERVLIADLLRCLPVRERQVLRMRFDGGFTQAEIGERIGVSQMQVSRILRGTLARLHVLVTDSESPAPHRRAD
jgi:RNA polymerase sigma-B factor